MEREAEMSPAIAVVVALTAFIAIMGVVGSRTNLRLARQFAGILEAAFRPIEKQYTNIGGVVGYHFQFDTATALGKIQGTMTFLPRHTVLYLPFSLLAGRQDRLSIVMHQDASPPGQGHVIDARHHRSGWLPIEDEENMNSTAVTQNGRDFIVLWYNPLVRDRLESALRRFPDAESLRHFAYNGADGSYLFEVQPRRATLGGTLTFLVSFIPQFANEPL